MDDNSRWSGRTAQIQRPPIAKVNALAARLAAEGRELVNLGQAILGLAPPEGAMQRVGRWIEDNPVHSYSPDPGVMELREAVAGYVRERKGVDSAGAERVMITCGANQAFVNALLTVTQPGDEVILLTPGYFDHTFAVKLASCVPVQVQLRLEDGRYGLDADGLRAAVTARTRVVVVVSPGNPTGTVFTRAEVQAVAEICEGAGAWLISDETYDLLTFDPAVHVSPISMSGERVIALGSFSKVFALASWRVGWMCGPAEMIEECIKVQDALVVCASVPSQYAALGALESVDGFVEGAVTELVARRGALMEVLEAAPGLDPVMPEGATFVMARLREGGDDVAFCEKLLVEQGIITVPGSAFGKGGAGHVRISFGNQPVEAIRSTAEGFSRV